MVTSGHSGSGETFDGNGLRVAIPHSRFNANIVAKLVDGAISELTEAGVERGNIHTFQVAGALELPTLCAKIARSGTFDLAVAVGVVVRGETPHFDHVSRNSIDGVQTVSRETLMPIGNAILTTNTAAEALARAGGSDGNKGAEAALAALELRTRLLEVEQLTKSAQRAAD